MPISISAIDKDGNTQKIQIEDKPFSEGADGAVFRSTDNRFIVKIYHDHPLPAMNEKVLNEILHVAPESNSPVANCLAWPIALTISQASKQVNGVVTVNVAYSRWMEQMTWYFSPTGTLSRPPDRQGNFAGRVKAAINLAEAVNYLNRIGYTHADLSGRNILCNLVEGRSVLFDMENLVVPGYMTGAVIGTPGFMAPELVQDMLTSSHVSPTAVTDRHALAVCLYQLLLMHHPLIGGKRKPLDSDPSTDELKQASTEYALYTEHSTDLSNRPPGPYLSAAILGSEMQELFRQTFEDGIRHPHKRPHPYEWVQALQHLQAELIQCPNPKCSWWGSYSSLGELAEACPMCGTPRPRKIAPELVAETPLEITDLLANTPLRVAGIEVVTDESHEVAHLQKPQPKIFISYSRKDWEQFAKPLAEHLTQAGMSVWVDQHLIRGGQDWLDELNKALDECQILVLCVSPDALASEWVKREYRYFLSEKKPIIPIICRETRLLVELRGIQFLHYSALNSLVDLLGEF